MKVPKEEEDEKEEEKPEPKKVSYDSYVTLKEIELQVKKGEFVCIIGDVGSGKSSILSTIIGDLIPINEKRNQIIRKNMDGDQIDERCADQMQKDLL